MEHDGSIFAGAIFMSNRATKLECLQRKLFGLPYSKAKFLKQVKAGMILFLFEHEERKLHGLFEATTDGALNIIPNAFRSTGQSFPAQIHFKRIWMCRPLCEEEFRGAIAENYYSPYKFHFGLSFGQVKSLIHLFYSKKINLKQDQRLVIPKIIERFEYSAADNARLSDKGTSVNYEFDELSREGRWEIRRQISHSVDAQISHPSHSCSETANSQHNSIYLPDVHASFKHSTTAEMVPGQSVCYISNLDDMVVPYDPDAPAFKLPCDNTIARTVKILEPNVLKPLDVVNEDRPHTSLLWHTSDYGSQPNQSEFPDYIPLPEEPQEILDGEYQSFGVGNYEYVSSTELGSCIPSTCKEISKTFHGGVANTDKDVMNAHQRVVAVDYPAAFVDGRLHSDSEMGRASVFSRLSRDQDVHDLESAELSTELTLEQLIGKLAEKKKMWSATKEPKQLMKWFNNLQNDRTVSTESFRLIDAQPVEWSNNDNHYKNITETESVGFVAPTEYDQNIADVSDASFELPFYNFRRRKISLESQVQDDLNACKEKTAVKSKRRLLRPSLNEGNQNAVEVGTMVSAQTKEEADAKMPAETISEYENENQANCRDVVIDSSIPVFQTLRKSETEDGSVEASHPAPVYGTEDYIPLD